MVRDAFRRRGVDAWSCDVEDAPGHHIRDDVLNVLNDGWDMMIAHPPCTHLAVSGARHFAAKRADGRQQRALEFALTLLNAPIKQIALENPVSIISGVKKPTQIIQPWMFGHDASKATCLWLKDLRALHPTKIVPPKGWSLESNEFSARRNGYTFYSPVPGKPLWANQTPSGQNKLGPSEDRAMIRSVTYTGIAEAMAEQWI